MVTEATKDPGLSPTSSGGSPRVVRHKVSQSYDLTLERDYSLSSGSWRRPQLFKIDTQATLQPPAHVSHSARSSLYSAISPLPRDNPGLGVAGLLSPGDHHHDRAPPSVPSLIPFSPISPSTSSVLGPLSAAVSAGTVSPLEDTSLPVEERRARRRQAIDFHSHAQLVEVFRLSDAEVEPDYVFDPVRASFISGHPGCRESVDDMCRDERNSQSSNPDGTPPTFSSVLHMVLGTSEDETDLDDFEWDAEYSDEEREDVDHADVDQPTQTGGNDETSKPVRNDPVPCIDVSELTYDVCTLSDREDADGNRRTETVVFAPLAITHH